MATGSHADVLIIGAGAAGGLIAKTLAEAGLKVVCLDQGPWFTPAREAACQPGLGVAAGDTMVDLRQHAEVSERLSDRHHLGKHADVERRRRLDHSSTPRSGPASGRAISAKGTEHGLAPDWPITYEDLAPWYDASDALIGVAGYDGQSGDPGARTVHDAAAGARCARRPGGEGPRPARLAPLGHAAGHPQRALRRKARLQQLQRLPERLPDRGAPRRLADAVAEGDRGGRAPHPECPGRRRSRRGTDAPPAPSISTG